MDLKEENILGNKIAEHWYYRAKTQAVLRLIAPCRKSVLWDVGAGSGFFSRQILETTSCREAVCIDTGYDADRDEVVAGKPIHFTATRPQTPADLVLLMDVLEHVEDDHALLDQYVAPSPSGTSFLVTVPAFQGLWSEHDEFLGHHRRYRLSAIEQVVARSGLQIDRACYFFGLVFPLAAAQRIFSRNKRHPDDPPRSQMRPFPAPLNFLLWTLCRMELPWFTANRLAGLTAMVLAHKP